MRGIVMRAGLSKTVLSRFAAVAAAFFIGVATLLVGPTPARAASVFIEVNPSTVLAGFAVSIRASCGSSVTPAKAISPAFSSGSVTLAPDKLFLIGTATVPRDKAAHGYPVRLSCKTGRTATTTLWVIAASSQPTRGPNTGGGFLAHQGGPVGPAMIGGGLAAVGVGGALAVWTARRRRAGTR
jgi:hypothetical protein